MNLFQIVLTTTLTSLISTTCGIVVTTMINYFKNNGKMAAIRTEIDRLNIESNARTIYRQAEQAGKISIQDMGLLRKLADCGHAIGMNGELTEIVELADKIPKEI